MQYELLWKKVEMNVENEVVNQEGLRRETSQKWDLRYRMIGQAKGVGCLCFDSTNLSEHQKVLVRAGV